MVLCTGSGSLRAEISTPSKTSSSSEFTLTKGKIKKHLIKIEKSENLNLVYLNKMLFNFLLF